MKTLVIELNERTETIIARRRTDLEETPERTVVRLIAELGDVPAEEGSAEEDVEPE